MSKIEKVPFQNGSTCRGDNYVVSDGSMDMARIRIDGRYPEDPKQWALNKVSRGIAHVVIGVATLHLKDEPRILVSANETVEIPPNTHYAWSGHFDMVTTWSPPFNLEQYEVKEG